MNYVETDPDILKSAFIYLFIYFAKIEIQSNILFKSYLTVIVQSLENTYQRCFAYELSLNLLSNSVVSELSSFVFIFFITGHTKWQLELRFIKWQNGRG